MISGRRNKKSRTGSPRPRRALIASRSGAVDLSSVMLGAAVVGIMATTSYAIIFGAVPWSQDRAAKQDLSAITVAQASAELKSDKFMSAGDLAAQGLLDKKNGSLVKVFDVKDGSGKKTGECYVGISVSGSGETYYVTDARTEPAKLPADASGVGCGSPALVKQMIGEVNYQVTGAPAAVPATPAVHLIYSGGTRLDVSWPDNAEAALSRRAEFYSLESRVGTGPWTVIDDRLAGTKSSVTGTHGERTSVRVRAGNAAGLSPYSAERGINIPAPPAKPVIGGAAATGPASAGFSWDAVSDATGYSVQYQVNYGPWLTRSGDQATTSLTVDGLVTGDRVKARARALNVSGSSAYAESEEVTIAGTVGTPVVSGSRSNAREAEFSWDPVGAAGYRVESRTGTGAWNVVSSSQKDTSVTVAGSAGDKIGVRVQAAGSTVYSAVSTVTLPVTPPAPVDVVGTLSDNTTVVFTWSAVPAATGYAVEVQTAGGWEIMPEQKAAIFTADASRALDGRIAIRVKTVGTAGTSAAGPAADVVLPSAPAAPVAAAELRSKSTVLFSWDDVPDAGSYAAQSRIAGGEWTDLDLETAALSTAVSAGPGQKIELRVKAVNSIGASAYSGIAEQTLPEPPAAPSPSVKAVSGTAAAVSWPAVPGAESYIVASSIAGDRFEETAVAGTGTELSTGAVPGKSLQVKVYAVNSVGRSAESPVVKLTLPVAPAAPAATLSEMTGTGMKVTWDPVPGASSYRVESGPAPWVQLGDAVTDNTVTLPAEPGQKVTVRVIADNIAGASEPSAAAVRTMLALPGVPEVKGESIAADSARFIWEGAAGAAKGYSVEKSIDGGEWQQVSTGTTDRAVVLTGEAGKTISLRVRSENAAGTSAWSAVESVDLPVRPAAPSIIGEPGSDYTADFFWSAPEDADTYDVEYRINRDGGWEVQSANQKETETTVMATAGTVVEVRVRAKNIAGESEFATAVVTMPGNPTEAMGALTVDASGAKPVVSWDKPAGAVKYRIRVTTDGTEPTAVNGTQSIQTGTSYTVSAPAGSEVKVRVQAGDAMDSWGTASTVTVTIP